MEEKEFILEALRRLLPTTEWYGETCHDNISYDNLNYYDDILMEVFNNLAINYFCLSKGNGSAEALSQKSKKIIENFVNYYEDIFVDVLGKSFDIKRKGD